VEGDRPLKVEFAYLKLLPREYSGPRHIVSVKRPDGRCNYEELTSETLLDSFSDVIFHTYNLSTLGFSVSRTSSGPQAERPA
jgi:hypothetical protein